MHPGMVAFADGKFRPEACPIRFNFAFTLPLRHSPLPAE